MLRGIKSSSARGYSFTLNLEVQALSYADDLAIAASSEEDVRAMIDRVHVLGRPAVERGEVCKLSTGYHDGKRLAIPSEFRFTGLVTPALTWDNCYKHLGVHLGPDPEACIGWLTKEFRVNTQNLCRNFNDTAHNCTKIDTNVRSCAYLRAAAANGAYSRHSPYIITLRYK